jgi:exopolysaccharide production protein ExoQ
MPQLALLLGCAFIWWLFRRDTRWRRLPSPALWIPGIWLALGSSRQLSFWIEAIGIGGDSEASNLEGSPINAFFNSGLFLAAILTLRRRRFSWGQFAAINKALVAIYLFFMCSMLWSPFPFPTVKRVVQDFGCVLTALVILTEVDPSVSMRILFVRVSYILFPLSVVFIRYYPHIGRCVSEVSGSHMLCGVAGHKNSLGQLAMVFCLVLVWDLIETWKHGSGIRPKPEHWPRLMNLTIGVYLLIIAASATSLMCFLLGVALLFAGKRLARIKSVRPLFMVGVLSFVSMLAFDKIFGISSRVSEALGRGTGLSGRTQIWQKILEKNTHHMIGSGFRGFWETSEGLSVSRELGTNLLLTAHNGYLEIYLHGGVAALLLLTVFIVITGHNSVDKLAKGVPIGRVAVVFWPILLIYCMTESAFFQISPLWFTMLLVTANVRRQDGLVESGHGAGSRRESNVDATVRRSPLTRARHHQVWNQTYYGFCCLLRAARQTRWPAC